MVNQQRIPAALIGCGKVADYGHLPALSESGDFELVAVADAQEETVQKIAAQYGAAGYTDYRDVLRRPEIGAVTISTPLMFHYEIAKAALLAGKHVFCEKPLADTPEQGAELVELAERSGLLLAMNLGYRLEEGAARMREILLSGQIGELQVMRFINNWGAHGVVGPWGGARRARCLQDSGGAMDCAVHFLDLARFFSGSEFASVTAKGQWIEKEFRWPGHALVTARMENGVLAHIESGFAYTHRSSPPGSFMQYDLVGDRGVVTWCAPLRTPGGTFADYTNELHVWTETGTEVIPFSTSKQFGKAYALWADCIRNGTMEGSPLATGQDGNEATRWMWNILDMTDQERQEFMDRYAAIV